MADNVAFTPGTGATGAADDIGGVLYPRVKIGLGADGSATDAVGGAGTNSAAVQRVTIATDDAIHAKLDAIETAVELIDNAISGTEMQVDVVAALPAGSNTIGTVNLSATDNAVLDAIDANTDNIVDALAGEYETVAASQTDQALGATGGTGDYLASLLIVPATTSPGAVSIKDGAGSAITVFTGGASSVSNLVPFTVQLGIYSGAGAWQVTTGANVSVIAAGNFT